LSLASDAQWPRQPLPNRGIFLGDPPPDGRSALLAMPYPWHIPSVTGGPRATIFNPR